MPHNSLPPKPADERQRRNVKVYESVPVEWDGIVRLPDLPEEVDWSPATLRWWKKWQESPQSMVMVESDYECMFEAALLHNKIWKNHETFTPPYLTTMMAELRRRVAAYGATWEDRRKLGMDILMPVDERQQEAAVKVEAEKGIMYLEMMKEHVAKAKEQGSTDQ